MSDQQTSYTAEQKATALLRKAKQKSQVSNMTPFDSLVGVFLGVELKLTIQSIRR